MKENDLRVQKAQPEDAAEIAQLLHDFNTEFGTPSPGTQVLSVRLCSLLKSPMTFVLVAGSPAVAVALVTLRTNVWYEGHVALLDELYVIPNLRGQGIGTTVMNTFLSTAKTMGISAIEINVDEADLDAQRFHERHGYSSTEPDTGERAFYYFREILP